MPVPRFNERQLEEAFLAKVRENPDTGCWEWQGAKSTANYGVFRVQGRNTPAHRWSHEKFIGPIPEGKYVCHACDNPPCCNPEHLFAGSQSDNMHDRVQKGRHPRVSTQRSGEGNSISRLTDEKVMKMRQRRREGATIAQLEAEFGVSEGTIRPALSGRTWCHVPGALMAGEIDRRRK